MGGSSSSTRSELRGEDWSLFDEKMREQKVRKLADLLAASPGAKATGLHIAVMGTHEGFGMYTFLEWLAGHCAYWKVRVFVHAVGLLGR